MSTEHEETYLALLESKDALIKILKSRDVEKIHMELEDVKKQLSNIQNDITRFIYLHNNIKILSISDLTEYKTLFNKLSDLK